ncbi:DUF6934 family protein [Chryseolinea lacunae]|uniref:Uncharacterized protein n=1 Tax=Chryseolinea lacunae TaxID=2801331 RepID=A0ABS1L004_9BACT|nr:hypothetical protein [Chryseolinea lacunae]MBL0743901.1 hypothetical protein [Chryseolinea lacunae]
MNLSYYSIRPDDEHLSYTFYSVGRRGRILKNITYRLVQAEPIQVFNLSLGEVDSETRQLRDDAITENGDRDKVLATVARSVDVFCEYHRDAYVVARGNTPARNRLYRMMISNNLAAIQSRYRVFGLVGVKEKSFGKIKIMMASW